MIQLGGLTLAWKESLTLSNIESDSFYISGLFKEGSVILGGDFNTILYRQEKKGGSELEGTSIAEFRDFLDRNHLTDLGFSGRRFTWSNRRAKENRILERLDRVVGNQVWQSTFPNSWVIHLDNQGSDHCPILIESSPNVVKAKKKFKFDTRWIGNSTVHHIIKEAWDKEYIGSSAFQIHCKLKACRHGIVEWAKIQNVNASNNILLLQEEVRQLKSMDELTDWETVRGKEKMLAEEITKEERYWQQKSRNKWLKFGDQNSKFFHAQTMQRRKRNKIVRLKKESGEWTTSQEDVASTTIQFYQELFSTSQPHSPEELLANLQKRVTPANNYSLTRPIKDLEIKNAAFSINPDGAPGSDGFSGDFYRTYWDIIGKDICKAVKSFFHSGKLLKSLNHTNLVLIPKIDECRKMADIRPISLCNVFYKIISKVMVSRLQPILPHIISMHQSAFIKGRLISDNIIIGHELMHHLKNRKKGGGWYMTAKLDMSKAYDRVEWSFLRFIMTKLGFCEKWIKWTMECVTSTTFSVIVNGESYGYFHPSRGIRQGDPLSPYLFLLCAEGFSYLLNNAESNGSIMGLKISRRCPSINHLLFADDSLLFTKAGDKEAHAIRELLKDYESISGQKINLDKSSLFFSANTSQAMRCRLANNLGIKHIGGQDKYLGLPALINRSKKETFSFIKDTVAKRLGGWKQNLLSFGGKEILIKTVATALPVYSMGCFKLPKGLCEELGKMVRKFWWNNQESSRKIHSIKWETMCRCKSEGGLGFKDLSSFNLALFSKLSWRLATEEHSLLFKLLKGKYFPNEAFMLTKAKGNSSWAWRSIVAGRSIIEKNWRWIVGKKTTLRIFEDPWIPIHFPFKPKPKVNGNQSLFWISQLRSQTHLSWEEHLISETIDEAEMPIIMAMKTTEEKDKIVWHDTNSSSYVVSRGYKKAVAANFPSLLLISQECSSIWKGVWAIKAPNKLKIFLWRALHNALPTNAAIHLRIQKGNARCKACSSVEESSVHVLVSCPMAKEVWFLSRFGINPIIPEAVSMWHWWSYIWKQLKNDQESMYLIALALFTLWRIWKRRNDLVFNERKWESKEVVDKAVFDLNEFLVSLET